MLQIFYQEIIILKNNNNYKNILVNILFMVKKIK